MAHGDMSPAMDYAEHERSYAAFTKLTALGTVVCLNIVLVLLISGLYSGAWGGAFLVLTLVGATVGLLANYSWIPAGFVLAITGVFTLLAFAG